MSMNKLPIKIAIGVGIIVMAFLGGRFSKSPEIRTVEIEKIKEIHHESTVIEKKVDIAELREAISAVAIKRNVATRRVVVEAADGTKTTTEEATDKTTSDSTTATKEAIATKTEESTKIWKETIRVEEKIKIVESLQKQWTASVQGGINVLNPIQGIPGYLVPDNFVVGAALDRRILGPLSLGVWANSRADAGIQLKLEF
jgi:hypothetical protein